MTYKQEALLGMLKGAIGRVRKARKEGVRMSRDIAYGEAKALHDSIIILWPGSAVARAAWEQMEELWRWLRTEGADQ